jgi:hypothetical protein
MFIRYRCMHIRTIKLIKNIMKKNDGEKEEMSN